MKQYASHNQHILEDSLKPIFEKYSITKLDKSKARCSKTHRNRRLCVKNTEQNIQCLKKYIPINPPLDVIF